MLRGTRRCAMRKLYIIRLTKQERVELQSVVKKLKGTGQKVRRAQILLKADADGPNWTDERIAEAYSCRSRTVERLRQRFVEQGFEETLNRVERKQPPVEKLLTGDQEARSSRHGRYLQGRGTIGWLAWSCRSGTEDEDRLGLRNGSVAGGPLR